MGKTEKETEKLTERYLMRLSPFAEVKVVELKEVTPSKTFTAEKCKEAEGQKIVESLPENAFVVALDEQGKQLSSAEFSRVLSENKDLGREMVFIIGGAYGLSEQVKNKTNVILSFSKMTFTHQMVRIFLLEQVYRGVCIMMGKAYHN